jgi:DNA-directed RNA polymerase subunit RPC12/RpoP
MGDARYLNQQLGKTFGRKLQDRPEGPMVLRALRDYRDRRAKSQRPLRWKSERRLKTVPVIGEPGARIRKIGRHYVKHHLVSTPVPDPKVRYAALMQRVVRRCDINEIGLTMTPTGLAITITNDRKKNRCRLLHIDVLTVTTPGFAQALFRHPLFQKANTVALDESMVPSLSGALRSVNTEIRRWFRSRKAVGAIEFGLVSRVRTETQESIAFLKECNLGTRVLRTGLRLLRREAILRCPHCGSHVVLKLDPQTLVPTGASAPCTECGVMLSAGHLLATRASAYVLYDWLYGHLEGRRSDRVDAAPKATTTTTITTRKKSRPSGPSTGKPPQHPHHPSAG